MRRNYLPYPFNKIAKKRARKAYNRGFTLGALVAYLVCCVVLLWPSRSEQ